jgi:predicted RNA-binding Zn-ribbon protein involved in translation (DUF1610 family)
VSLPDRNTDPPDDRWVRLECPVCGDFWITTDEDEHCDTCGNLVNTVREVEDV